MINNLNDIILIVLLISAGMSLATFIAIMFIWHYIKEIATNTSAIPGVIETRAKAEAKKIIEVGYIYDAKRMDIILLTLSHLSNDQEALQLISALAELKKKQTA